MSNNILNTNFWELLSTYEIEIPIIQRDYVQGKEENKKIRDKIVSKFVEASRGNPTKLDFIYGNIKNNIFYPLDGQQRLTTLYLYYLYFALRDDKIKDFKVNVILEKFTYSTRVSSKEFFRKLLCSVIKIDKSTTISNLIVNQNWFITYWKNDPTVSSALGMLDEIHNQCFQSKIDFESLVKRDNKDITFEFLELEKFGLSDDLYIKMNARGKTLSAYENFKADLIGYIKKNDWELEVQYQERFSTKLDGKWTDYFWDGGKNRGTFDTFFINFFHQFLITEIATRNELSNQIIQNNFTSRTYDSNQKRTSTDELLTTVVSSHDNISETYLDEQSFKNLYNLLELYATVSKSLNIKSNLWISDFTSVDMLLTNSRITYPNRVFHFAHSCYLLKSSNHNDVDYDKWMRVIRNIITNSTIDTIETLRGVLLLINELSEGCNSIYKFLSTNHIKSRFAERQVKEEIFKSKLLIDGLLSYDDLAKIEDHRLCFGRIEFILNCIDNNDYSKVKDILEIFNRYFNDNDFSNEIRALFLTCGDGKFYNYWATSWVYVVDLPKRCLMESTNELRTYSYNLTYQKYFVDVIKKLLINADVTYHLKSFVNSAEYVSVPRWKQRVIGDYKILDNHCKSKMIAVAHDDSDCYLMNVGKPRSREPLKRIS